MMPPCKVGDLWSISGAGELLCRVILSVSEFRVDIYWIAHKMLIKGVAPCWDRHVGEKDHILYSYSKWKWFEQARKLA